MPIIIEIELAGLEFLMETVGYAETIKKEHPDAVINIRVKIN